MLPPNESLFPLQDFTEVDTNVTRHVGREMAAEDWSVLVLHLLGLDHIGHKMGALSRNMPPKQKEMDDLVRQIVEAQEVMPHLRSSLMVLCGDHGMTDTGNHGGSSASETSTAMLLISPRLRESFFGEPSPLTVDSSHDYYEIVEQPDIIPTLSVLLGFPIPKNSLGVLIPKVLAMWPCMHRTPLLSWTRS